MQAMGWRFRKSFTVIPGLRLNLSKSGLSASIGGAPLTLNVGPRGLTGTASIPGTGISFRQHLGNGSQDPSNGHGHPGAPTVPAGSPHADHFVNTAPIEEIHSSSTEQMTSASLKDVKALIQTAFHQREEIAAELDTARDAKVEAEQRFDSWNNGFLFKRIFKSAFAKRQEVFAEETAKVDELEEQLKLSSISTYIELEKDQSEAYFRLRDDFAALSESAAIWDVKTRQATDQFHERTTAHTKVAREKVGFELGQCDLIQWDQKIPHLKNAKGGDIFLFPGFILYRAAKEAFSLIEYQDVSGKATNINFQETEGVPSDSKVIGQTWAKANKDGTRDRRFADNYEIPIAQYGAVSLTSENGLWEEFHFSNLQKMVNFFEAWHIFAGSFERVAHTE